MKIEKFSFLRGEPYFFKINKYSFARGRTSYCVTVNEILKPIEEVGFPWVYITILFPKLCELSIDLIVTPRVQPDTYSVFHVWFC